MLHGKLANIAADLDQRSLSSTGIFKELTSGDPITAEEKHKTPFTFRPFAKLLFSTNELPFSPDHSKGYLRRLVIIPFNKVFLPGKADPNLLAKLTMPDELSGLLNMALMGLQSLLKKSAFTIPVSSKAALKAYRDDITPVRRFIDDVCEVAPNNPTKKISKGELYNAYRAWCVGNGLERIANEAKFAQELRQAVPGVYEYRPRGGERVAREREWIGIALLPAEQVMLGE